MIIFNDIVKKHFFFSNLGYVKTIVILSLRCKTIKRTVLDNDQSPFIIEDLKDDTGFLMLQVSNLWYNSHDKALKRYHGLSHMQYAILASVCWLKYSGNVLITQSFLAQHTKINPMTVSQILKVLEAKGYVHRSKHPNDVRAKDVYLTKEGKDLMDKAFQTIWDIDARFFKILGKNNKSFNGFLYELLKEND